MRRYDLSFAAAALALAGATAAGAQEAPRWSLGEPLQIGVVFGDPAYEFGDIGGAVQLTGGGIVVAETQSDELRFYDRAGTLVARQGREGEGPGEYLFVRWLGECAPDSVFAMDGRQDRMTVLDAEAGVARVMPRPAPVAGQGIYRSACDTTGVMAVASWPSDEGAFRDPTMGAYSPRFRVATATPDGAVGRDLGEFPAGERVLSVVDDQVRGSGPRQFGTETFLAVGGGRIYIGYSGGAEVVVVEEDGRRRTAPLPVERRPIPERDLDAFRERAVANAAAERRPAARRHWGNYDFPDAYPAFSDLRADPAGNLWVRRYPAVGDAMVEWLVLDPAMRPIGRLAVPAGLDVTDVGEHYLLGVWRDADGVQYVRRYPLSRADR